MNWALRCSRACFTGIEEVGAIVAAVGAVAGTATSVYGQIQAGQAQQKAAAYNQQVDQNNALQAQQAADQQAIVAQEQTRTKLGQQAAAYAGSGVEVGTGSALDVMSDTAAKGRLDAQTLRYGGAVTAQRDLEAGSLAAYQGSQAATAADFSAGSTLLTSAGNLYRTYGGGGGGGATQVGAQTIPSNSYGTLNTPASLTVSY